MIRKIILTIAVCTLAFSVQLSLGDFNPEVDTVFDELMDAVVQDDNEAYLEARKKALNLDDNEFNALLNKLNEACNWRALGVRYGLLVRREKPEVADDFEEQLNSILHDLRERGPTRRDGTWPMYRLRRNLPRTDPYTALRFEAVLTEKSNLPPLTPPQVRPEYDQELSFRRQLYGGVPADDPDEAMHVFLKMMEDPPPWTSGVAGIHAVAKRDPDAINKYIPKIVDWYKTYRRKYESPTAGRRLVMAISEASDREKALSALKEIRRFERERMTQQGFEPWVTKEQEIDDRRDSVRDRLREKRQLLQEAKRESREEDVEELSSKKEKLAEKEQNIRYAWRASIQWKRVNESIEELKNK